MTCLVYELGKRNYDEVYRLQRRLRRLRIEDAIPDVLLLLEHPPTITLGRRGRLDNVLVSMDQLREEGIALFFAGRGGDVTYHGPGQLVAYPILSLKERDKDVHRYVRDLEEVTIRTLGDFGIEGERDRSHPGIWVDSREVAAIGLSIKQWVTMHGLALNVNTDLGHFTLIHPCGLANRKATSMAEILGSEVPLEALSRRFIAHFSEVFGTDIEYGGDLHEVIHETF